MFLSGPCGWACRLGNWTHEAKVGVGFLFQAGKALPRQQAELTRRSLEADSSQELAIAHKHAGDLLCSELTPHVWRLKCVNEWLCEVLDIFPASQEKKSSSRSEGLRETCESKHVL